MDQPEIVGRYAIFDRIAAGGMASVHLGRLLGEAGFTRTVAIKRLHPQNALDPDFVAMFLDEARLAARIRHPNVVPTLDVVASGEELFLVMEYVEGESLSRLLKPIRESATPIDTRIVVAIVVGMLAGLNAAHEAKSDHGQPLDIVHRDVSPQNVIVGVDGVPRLVDFGVAKAVTQIHTTREGQIKGKLAYMAPEQLTGKRVTRQSDVFAAAIVMWELLTLKRLFASDSEGDIVHKVLHATIEPPSKLAPGVPAALDEVVLKGLERDTAKRWQTAAEMAHAIEAVVEPASAARVGQWVRQIAAEVLASRASLVASIESNSALAAIPIPPESRPTGARLSGPRSSPSAVQKAADAQTVVTSDSVAMTAMYPSSRKKKRALSRLKIAAGAAAVAACVTGAVVAAVWAASQRGAAANAPSSSAVGSAAPSAIPSSAPTTTESSSVPVVPVTALPSAPAHHSGHAHVPPVTPTTKPTSAPSSTSLPNATSLVGRE